MIYFIAAGDEYVKIGFTKESVDKRLAILQVHNPLDLKLIAVMDGGLKEEKRLHYQFNSSMLHGEWFILNRKIRNFIANNTKIFFKDLPQQEESPIPLLTQKYPNENDIYYELNEMFGNYTRVADILGLTPRQYRRLRNGKCKLKQKWIDKLKAAMK